MLLLSISICSIAAGIGIAVLVCSQVIAQVSTISTHCGSRHLLPHHSIERPARCGHAPSVQHRLNPQLDLSLLLGRQFVEPLPAGGGVAMALGRVAVRGRSERPLDVDCGDDATTSPAVHIVSVVMVVVVAIVVVVVAGFVVVVMVMIHRLSTSFSIEPR